MCCINNPPSPKKKEKKEKKKKENEIYIGEKFMLTIFGGCFTVKLQLVFPIT